MKRIAAELYYNEANNSIFVVPREFRCDGFIPETTLQESLNIKELKCENNAIPFVNLAPVINANWELPEPEGVISYNKKAYVQCSNCKKKSHLGWTDKFCKHCGATMLNASESSRNPLIYGV